MIIKREDAKRTTHNRKIFGRGFTLIELLVVISIIALLLSIMMPALNRAKEAGKKVLCLSNLHTVTLAWMTYATANDDKLVGSDVNPGQWVDRIGSPLSPHYGNANWTGYQLRWSGTEEDLIWEREDAIKRGVLWPYMEDLGSYKCPSHQKNSTPEQIMRYPLPPRDPRKLSYVIVGLLNGTSVWTGGRLEVYRKMSQIRRPGEKLALTEQHDPRGGVGDSWAWTYTMQEVKNQSTYMGEFINMWHTGGQCWARCDGSALHYKWKEAETIDAAEAGVEAGMSAGNEDMMWIARGMPGL